MLTKDHIEANSIPEPNTGCWLWLKSLNGRGYPNQQAHRQSYILFNGAIPDGLLVRHKCDQPSCVNPAHLEVGTQAENIADIFRRGRGYNFGKSPFMRGERKPSAKLTEADVRAIRSDARSGNVVGKDYGVTATTIWKIRARLKWAHVS